MVNTRGVVPAFMEEEGQDTKKGDLVSCGGSIGSWANPEEAPDPTGVGRNHGGLPWRGDS